MARQLGAQLRKELFREQQGGGAGAAGSAGDAIDRPMDRPAVIHSSPMLVRQHLNPPYPPHHAPLLPTRPPGPAQ